MKATKKQNNKLDWIISAALIVLSLVPVAAGAARLTQLAGGAQITAENARFFASPIPVAAHIIGASLFSMLGALQFAPNFRRRKLRWHRWAGKWILFPSGFVAALSGLWMTQFYPWPAGDGGLLYVLRLLFGSAMLLSLIFSVILVWQRNYAKHGEWVMRGYAIGLGAGTQVFTHLPWLLFFGVPNEFTRAMLMGAGWVINMVVVEWIIRRQRIQRVRASLAYA